MQYSTPLNHRVTPAGPVYQIGNDRKYLVERSDDAPSGWKMTDRLDAPVEPEALHQRYGIWQAQPQPEGFGAKLLRFMGAYPVSNQDTMGVTPFPKPNQMTTIGMGMAAQWSSAHIHVGPDGHTRLIEDVEATSLVR